MLDHGTINCKLEFSWYTGMVGPGQHLFSHQERAKHMRCRKPTELHRQLFQWHTYVVEAFGRRGGVANAPPGRVEHPCEQSSQLSRGLPNRGVAAAQMEHQIACTDTDLTAALTVQGHLHTPVHVL